MSKTIEISRELLSHAAAILSSVHSDVAHQLTALLAAPVVERQEPAAWVNDQQLLLCSKSPREDQPNNPMMHNLPRNIAGSALKTDYCNTPLYTSPSAPVAAALTEQNLEAAAKTLASCMDYPWEHMPEQGRAAMREHAKAIIEASNNKPDEAKA